MRKFTDEQVDFIVENYPEHGVDVCVEKLGLTIRQVRGIAQHNKLRRRDVVDTDYPISTDNLFNFDDPIKAYCLGLLWTDGCVHKKQIFLTSTEPDASFFETKMMEIGKWGISRRKDPKFPTWKERVAFQTTNPFLAERLKQLNFNSKEEGFDLLYQTIPEDLQRYFWIGMVDGDGSFYINEKRGMYVFSLCSSHNQDWNCFTNFLESLSIRYKIERTMSKGGNYSKVFIRGKYEVKKFGDYLYSSFDQDGLGLDRKYQIYKSIKDRCKEIQPKYWGKSKAEIKNLEQSYLTQ